MEYESEEAFRARLEAIPVYGQPTPFVRSLLREHAKGRADCIGLLMQVFSPGRFIPAYWERFGLPDPAKEFEELDLRTRVVPLGKILTQEGFGEFKDKVNAVLIEWIDWRRRAIDAGILTALQKIGGRRVIDTAWQQWVDEHRGLKEEWDDLGETIDELHRDLAQITALIDTREGGQDAGSASDEEAHYSPKRLAEKYGVKAEPLRKALERLRKQDHNCFVENENRAGNEPQYLYKLSAALPIIERMKQAEKTSRLRPA